jgi:SNW domain-containing protein 1
VCRLLEAVGFAPMASLKDVLPAPTNRTTVGARSDSSNDAKAVVPKNNVVHPEMHVVPAPGASRSGVSAVVSLPAGADGAPDFTAVARVGVAVSRGGTSKYAPKGPEGPEVVVHTSYEDLVEKSRGEMDLRRPSGEEEEKTVLRTRAALTPIVLGKVAASLPKNFRGASDKRVATYVRYTPASTNTSQISGARQRIIKMVEAPIDPMEPPRFSQKKTPVNPPSPPVPVLHSPTRKPTKEELADWVVPPAISNWKNNRGYTVPLDKRLAADGAGMHDNRINDRFASLAESLYAAERTARDQVEKRAQIQRDVSLKAKEAKEKELRDLAARARLERAGFSHHIRDEREGQIDSSRQKQTSSDEPDNYAVSGPPRRLDDDSPPSSVLSPHVDGPTRVTRNDVSRRNRPSRFGPIPDGDGRLSDRSVEESDTDAGEEDARRRDAIREERRRERDRELRLREGHGDESVRGLLKKAKLTRDRDRDISERVALGQLGSLTDRTPGEVMYDQRLFNQGGSARGIKAGFGAEDADSLYDKPLFGSGNASSKFQYHPRVTGNSGDQDDGGAHGDAVRTSRFKADKGFSGANNSTGAKGLDEGPRTRPVEFEREHLDDAKSAADLVQDPFGLDKFL